MTPQQTCVLHQTHSSTITPKVQMIYKLFLLENARSTLEQELRSFTKQAYEEVHNVLHSSSPTTVFNDLTKKLDAKCQEIGKLSASLKDFVVESKLSIQSSVRTHYFHPVKENPIMGAFKFGPLLQNFLMASSISKAVHALGAALSCQQQNSQPVVVQQVNVSSSMSPSFNITLTSSSSRSLKPEEPSVLEEKGQLDSVCVPPAITQSCSINEEKSNMLLPPMPDAFPKINNRKQPTCECEDDAKVQHQKQSSSQLLHLFRVKTGNECVLKVPFLEWTKSKFEANNSDSPEQMSPSVKTQSHRFRHVVTDPVGELPLTSLHASVESQAPIFRVKRVKSSGSLIYSCVIASETELWDVGDVFANVLEEDFARMTLESEKGQNTVTRVQDICRNRDWKTHTLQATEPELRSPTPKRVSIPEFHIQKFEETEVVVSHVVDPGSFYIQRADSLQKLQPLFTGCEAVRTYAEQKCIPDIGAHVIGYFSQDKRWCRAQVMKICGVSRDNNAVDGAGSIKVEVKRLDYGDTSCLSLWCMKELTPEMADLPLQALQVSLANVTPINGSHWSEEAVAWIRVMVHNRTLYARFYPQGSTVAVELFLERGKLGAMRRGASLSLRLAQNGHAKHDKFRNAAFSKKSAVQGSDWGKYLISCYAQTKK